VAGGGNRSRRKGRDGEAEVAAIWRAAGFDVRGLEGEGDHTVMRLGEMRLAEFGSVTIHSEVKRCERIRAVEWIAQAEREAPDGAVPVVSFRQSHGRWYALLPLEDLARLLA
jgi:hypothetical protein